MRILALGIMGLMTFSCTFALTSRLAVEADMPFLEKVEKGNQ